MPSAESSRRNLKLAQNPWTERSRDESALIWQLSLYWWMPDLRNPRTQDEWAGVLGVRQPYVAKMVRRFKREWLDLANRWPEATLEDLRKAQEKRERAQARLAEERLWEQYDKEQRRLAMEESDETCEEGGQ